MDQKVQANKELALRAERILLPRSMQVPIRPRPPPGAAAARRAHSPAPARVRVCCVLRGVRVVQWYVWCA